MTKSSGSSSTPQPVSSLSCKKDKLILSASACSWCIPWNAPAMYQHHNHASRTTNTNKKTCLVSPPIRRLVAKSPELVDDAFPLISLHRKVHLTPPSLFSAPLQASPPLSSHLYPLRGDAAVANFSHGVVQLRQLGMSVVDVQARSHRDDDVSTKTAGAYSLHR